MELGSLVTSIAMEMVVPILLGYWLDQRLGIKGVFTSLGAALGLTGGLWHLIKIRHILEGKSGKDRDRDDDVSRQ